MRKMQIFMVFLALASVAGCSGGQGQNPVGGSSASPPPPPPPTAAPPPPRPDPTPTASRGALVCSPCKKLVFMSGVPDQYETGSEIYSVSEDGTALTRLTDNQSYDGEPAWSPDGQRIVFTSGRDFSGDAAESWFRSELYVMDADGSHVRRLTSSTGGAWNPAWSPDGSRIVYETVSNGSNNLWEVPVDGGTATPMFSTPGVDMQPAWSPDGTRLAVVSDWFAYDSVWDIFLINADGTGFSAVTDGNIFDHRDYVEPTWSPDGSRIALGTTLRRGTFEYATQIGVLTVNSSNIALLPGTEGTSETGASGGTPSWSPDGTLIAYAACDLDHCDIRWIKADGSEYGEIVRNGAHPDWQR